MKKKKVLLIVIGIIVVYITVSFIQESMVMVPMVKKMVSFESVYKEKAAEYVISTIESAGVADDLFTLEYRELKNSNVEFDTHIKNLIIGRFSFEYPYSNVEFYYTVTYKETQRQETYSVSFKKINSQEMELEEIKIVEPEVTE